MLLIIGLILLGILLLILEIMILPGMIAGIIGAVFLIVAIAWMYADYGTEAGHYTLFGTLVVTFGAIWYAFKSGAWTRFSLKGTIDGKVNEVSGSIQEGAEGITRSALRPSGKIAVGDLQLEGYTNGEILPPNTPVRILKVEPGKVLVEKILVKQ